MPVRTVHPGGPKPHRGALFVDNPNHQEPIPAQRMISTAIVGADPRVRPQNETSNTNTGTSVTNAGTFIANAGTSVTNTGTFIANAGTSVTDA